ncbi:MAG: sulfatase-like hydrolase/transferase [Bacillus subtilis]|nr:sulfatase-like hydrolase/transferase [Bacillus subtilis]
MLKHTTILYTADHSQTLFENGASWAHCNYTPQEAMVPLIMIGTDLPPVDTKYHASHANILPTILDLMGVPPEGRKHAYAPSLFLATEEMNSDRFFLDGALRLIDFPDP